MNLSKRKIYVFLIFLGFILSSTVIHAQRIHDDKIITNSNENDDFSTIFSNEFVPGELIIGFKKHYEISKNMDNINNYLRAENVEPKSYDYNLNLVKIKVDSGSEKDYIKNIKDDPFVEYVEPNYIAYASIVPNDPRYNDQYALDQINCPDGWDESTGDNDITIAIIDTGVDYNHEDLSDDINGGYDFVDINFNEYPDNIYRFKDGPLEPYYDDYKTHDDDPMDVVGHGTHCAGIAGAVTNNNIGISGVSWDCSIMPIRAGFKCEVYFGGSWYEAGLFEYDDIKNAIEYAADNNADIISMSFGGPESSMIQDICNYAYNKGSLLVSSSGNEGKQIVGYPARYEEVIAVGAIDEYNNRCSFSNMGPNLELVAPGYQILSTIPGDNYDYISGTSMAAPHVAGVAALAKSRYPSYSNIKIRQLLCDSADDLGLNGRDNTFGYGRVDATLIDEGITPPEEPRIHITMDYVEKIDEIDPAIDPYVLWELNGRLPEWYYEISIVNLDDYNDKKTQMNYNRYGEWPWQWNHEDKWDLDGTIHEFGVFDYYRVGIEVKLIDRDPVDITGDDIADVSGDNSEIVFRAIYDMVDDDVDVWINSQYDDWDGPDSEGYITLNGEIDENPGDEDDAKIRLKIEDNYEPPEASASIENSPSEVATGEELNFQGSVAAGAAPYSWEWRLRSPNDPMVHSTNQNTIFSYESSDIGKTYNPSLEVIDGLGYSDKAFVGLIEVIAPSIEIISPRQGYIYSKFTGEDGKHINLLGNLIFYLQYDLEVTANAIGVDEVKFILLKNDVTQDSEYVSSSTDIFSYNFRRIGIGFFKVKLEGYQNDIKVSSYTLDKIFSISI